MNLVRTLSNDRGIATSLIETVLVIAVAAMLGTVTMMPALGGLDDAKVAKAFRETELIGLAMHGFARDTGRVPAFKSGLATLPTDEIYQVLETEGSDALDETESWPTDAASIDLFENHIVMNQPGETAPAYPRVGEIFYDRLKGWNGPYLAELPGSDPWGNKYLANVQFLTPQGVALAVEDTENPLTVPTGARVAVVVLSPGANRTIETEFAQIDTAFSAGGDDIIYRIQ